MAEIGIVLRYAGRYDRQVTIDRAISVTCGWGLTLSSTERISLSFYLELYDGTRLFESTLIMMTFRNKTNSLGDCFAECGFEMSHGDRPGERGDCVCGIIQLVKLEERWHWKKTALSFVNRPTITSQLGRLLAMNERKMEIRLKFQRWANILLTICDRFEWSLWLVFDKRHWNEGFLGHGWIFAAYFITIFAQLKPAFLFIPLWIWMFIQVMVDDLCWNRGSKLNKRRYNKLICIFARQVSGLLLSSPRKTITNYYQYSEELNGRHNKHSKDHFCIYSPPGIVSTFYHKTFSL